MTQRVLIAAFLAALAAGPAFAYVPPHDMNMKHRPIRLSDADETSVPLGPPIRQIVQGPSDGDGPGHPVPEPGTIAMASMGLMALGAHLRRRRGN